MELMSVAQGQIWIHSETKGKIYVDQEKLSHGMPIWEKGNAFYLRKKKGAKLVNPDSFQQASLSYFFPKDPVTMNQEKP